MNSIILPDFIKKPKKIARERLEGELRGFELNFEWAVVAFAVGIGLYFALPFEPQGWVLMVICIVAGFGFFVFQHASAPTQSIMLILVLIAAGLGRSAWHTDQTARPILPSYERAYVVTGWVKAIEKSGSRTRWAISVQQMEGRRAEATPEIIRTTSAGEGVRAGDAIRIRSILSAPPGPAVPGGYDPARRAFFQRVGGYGYAISKPESAVLEPLSLLEKIERRVVRFRYHIADRVIAAAPEKTAGLQASLLTGIRTYIPSEQTDALRTAGLAHILAISGLHMGLVAFGIYSLGGLMLACILPLSRRYDMRKAAAVLGGLAATFYLVLSGASVATQRAYIMVMIVFLAVILDRRAFSMRSVALAAGITLLVHPEAFLGAGFQMSFSAVAALVAVYRAWDSRREFRSGALYRAGNAIGSLTMTSFIAGFATAAFAVLHFNRMASYGLAGNLLAMPIFTFLVMPAAIAVFPALLIGQEEYPLWVMGQGLELVIVISDMVAGWPGALAHIKAAPGSVIALYGFAFTCICLGPKLMRALGMIGVAICFVMWAVTPVPDLRVSKDGAVAFRTENASGVLYVARKRADSYGREQFTRRAGLAAPELVLYRKAAAKCDARACRTDISGRTVSIASHPSEVIEECASVDIVILTNRAAGPIARRGCGAVLIDGRSLRKSGALDVYLTRETIRLESALTKSRANRPWGRSY